MTHAQDQAPGLGGRPIEVMLVEDNYGDVLLAQEAFKASAIASNVSVAGDGEIALSMLRKQAPFEGQVSPDLILLDLNLPKLDGREVLEALKRDEDLLHIPVVVLTGSRAAAEIMRSYALHANAYIVKPVNFERLKEIIAAIEAFWFSVVVLPANAKKEA